MSGRIVVFGATGYTGELTARALVKRGATPVLAGRDREKLDRLAAELGRVETALADASQPSAVRALVGPGDVLVATAGPFARIGATAVEAAIDARATYIDCAAEPAFIRAVFERYGSRARATGTALLPATGYESVPGNLAAALALEQAGEAATAVEIGYFTTGRFRTSGGTRASIVLAALADGFAFRDGRLVSERQARRVHVFDVHGRRRSAISTSTAEHLTLPRAYPRLRTVDAYLGWFGRASRPLQAASAVGVAATRVPGVRAGLTAVANRVGRGSTGRAESGSYVIAVARDADRRALAEVRLEGIDAYELSGNILAWAAIRAAGGSLSGTGALGPVEAFGLGELKAGCAEAGMSITSG